MGYDTDYSDQPPKTTTVPEGVPEDDTGDGGGGYDSAFTIEEIAEIAGALGIGAGPSSPKDDYWTAGTGYTPPSMITGETAGASGIPAYGPGVEPDAPPIGWWHDPAEQGAMPPQYVTGDPTRILNGMSVAELDALERELVRAGYLDEDETATYSPGGARASLIPAFTYVVTYADANRVSWEKQLEGDVNRYQQWLEDNPEETPKTWAQNNPFVAPVELKPDYATLAQGVKGTIRDGLQRDPTTGEMKLLTGFMGDTLHDQWKANEYDVAYADWQNRARAHESESNQMEAPVVQGVDAAARYGEYFDERFEGELDHRERVAQSATNTPSLFGSIDTLSRMTS